MRIFFDCTALSVWRGHVTGIQRLVMEIGKHLVQILPQAHLVTFSPDGSCRGYRLDDCSESSPLAMHPGDIVVSAGSNWDFPDHHRLLINLKNRSIRLGFVFYDIIPILLPLAYGVGFAKLYEAWLRDSLQAADIAFAISRNTKNDLIQYAKTAGITIPQIHILRLGDNIPADLGVTDVKSQSRTERYILSVGTLEYRKNHIVLLNAYRFMIDDLRYQPPKLYIVGKPGWLGGDLHYQVMHDIRLRDNVEILEGISDADLQSLYRSALFTVYPSLYEGWGLPVAESLMFGRPCVTSRTSSMIEIAPHLTRFAHPMLVNEWSAHIRALSENDELLEREVRAVRATYKPTHWRETSAQLATALVETFEELGKS